MFNSPFSKSSRKLFITSPRHELEPQEVFLDRLVRDQGKEGEEKKLEIPFAPVKVGLLYGCFLLLLLLFFGRTFQFQIVAHADMEKVAQDNAIRRFPTMPERGVIYDTHMRQLVWNKPSFDFVCDKRDLPQARSERERMFQEIASLFGIPLEALKANFDSTLSPDMLVAENLSHGQFILIQTTLQEFSGCSLRENRIREYATPASFAHILGYTAKISEEELDENPGYTTFEHIGKTGVEKAYENFLRGKPGYFLFEKDAYGRTVQNLGEIPSVPGASLVLWLDGDLQEKITKELEEALTRIGRTKAAAVAIDPRTGGVLALVSLPSFDNNLFAQGLSQSAYEEILADPSKPLFSRAIGGLYPTGSTIKPLLAAAALQEQIIDPDKALFTHGYIEVPNQYDPTIVYRFNDWKDHGWVDMRKALAVSSNVYFYTIGGGFEGQKGLGPSRIKEYLSRFGWGEKTGIDLRGESAGLIPDPEWKKRIKKEGWWDGDTYLLSIGQGNLLATPLQVANAFASIANGGTLYKPQMVKKVIASSQEQNLHSEEETRPRIIRENIVDLDYLNIVKEGMRQSVIEGSAILLNALPVKVAAKTGSAQTGKKDGEGKDLLYFWTTAFASYEDPEIVLTVMVEDVQEGSRVALPVVRNVLDWYFNR